MNDKNILLVEDNPDEEALTLRALRKGRILDEVVVAHDGVEALDYLFGTGLYAGRDLSINPKFVLLDLKLPRVGGLEVLKRLRADQRTKDLPVVVLTSSNERKDIADSYDSHVNSYIRKPVDAVQFAEVVQHLGLYWSVFNEPPTSRTEA